MKIVWERKLRKMRRTSSAFFTFDAFRSCSLHVEASALPQFAQIWNFIMKWEIWSCNPFSLRMLIHYRNKLWKKIDKRGSTRRHTKKHESSRVEREKSFKLCIKRFLCHTTTMCLLSIFSTSKETTLEGAKGETLQFRSTDKGK